MLGRNRVVSLMKSRVHVARNSEGRIYAGFEICTGPEREKRHKSDRQPPPLKVSTIATKKVKASSSDHGILRSSNKG